MQFYGFGWIFRLDRVRCRVRISSHRRRRLRLQISQYGKVWLPYPSERFEYAHPAMHVSGCCRRQFLSSYVLKYLLENNSCRRRTQEGGNPSSVDSLRTQARSSQTVARGWVTGSLQTRPPQNWQNFAVSGTQRIVKYTLINLWWYGPRVFISPNKLESVWQ